MDAIEKWIDRLEFYLDVIDDALDRPTEDPALWIIRFSEEATMGNSIDLQNDWVDMLEMLAVELGLESSDDIPSDTRKMLTDAARYWHDEFERMYLIWDNKRLSLEDAISDGSAYIFTALKDGRKKIEDAIDYLNEF